MSAYDGKKIDDLTLPDEVKTRLRRRFPDGVIDLSLAADHARLHRDKVVVIKVGGACLAHAPLRTELARQVAVVEALGSKPVLVHGAGPQLPASELKPAWDRALFDVDAGDSTRMAYWASESLASASSMDASPGRLQAQFDALQAEMTERARREKRERARYREDPDPHFLTFGPKTRRAFLANLQARGGSPV